MNERQRRAAREALDARRSEVLAQGAAKIEPNRTDEAAVGVPDEDAQALSEMLQTLASTRNREQALLLEQIDRALHKLTEAPDEYGLCEECEEEIQARRLSVMPWVTYCIECQTSRDPKRDIGRRKVTDYK